MVEKDVKNDERGLSANLKNVICSEEIIESMKRDSSLEDDQVFSLKFFCEILL